MENIIAKAPMGRAKFLDGASRILGLPKRLEPTDLLIFTKPLCDWLNENFTHLHFEDEWHTEGRRMTADKVAMFLHAEPYFQPGTVLKSTVSALEYKVVIFNWDNNNVIVKKNGKGRSSLKMDLLWASICQGLYEVKMLTDATVTA